MILVCKRLPEDFPAADRTDTPAYLIPSHAAKWCLMRGKWIALSNSRRFIGDLLHFGQQVPTVPVQRSMNLQELVKKRAALKDRPAWTAIFAKAFALVADEMPVLRRAYVKLPWPHLYEYPTSVASIAVERTYEGEPTVFLGLIKNPAALPLMDLTKRIRALSATPVDQIKTFRRILLVSRWPCFLRRWVWWLGLNLGRQRGNYFGTYGVTVYSALGAESLHPLSPLTATLNYGVIAPQGTVDVRLVYDHRVMDGATVARALSRLETALVTLIVEELRGR
jgi:hypothetical protein